MPGAAANVLMFNLIAKESKEVSDTLATAIAALEEDDTVGRTEVGVETPNALVVVKILESTEKTCKKHFDTLTTVMGGFIDEITKVITVVGVNVAIRMLLINGEAPKDTTDVHCKY